MKTLILLCGQGSTGKSTLGLKLCNKYNKNASSKWALIRMDLCCKGNTAIPDYDLFIKQIQEAYKNNEYTHIVCDFSNTSISNRKKLLSSLNFDFTTVNLIVIQLRPPVEKIIEWSQKRNSKIILSKNMQDKIKTWYYNYEFATKEEFKLFNFNDIKIILFDNYNEKILYEEK